MSTSDLPAANYDEMKVGAIDLPPLRLPSGEPPRTANEARQAQAAWRQVFADGLYGEIPSPPDSVEVTRHTLPDPHAERLVIRLTVEDRSFQVDAALWLPAGRTRVPIVAMLDFLGPLGTLSSAGFPLDPAARVPLPAWFGSGHGGLAEEMRGTTAGRVPVQLLLDAGYGVLSTCYGSWVPDDARHFRDHGLWPLLGIARAPEPPGAIALWSWAIQRLLDVAAGLPEADAGRLVVAGHSRLGKAALWAAANDQRIYALFLNESGCAGASLSRRNFGETLAHNRRNFPHWLLPAERAERAGLAALDQHQLLAQLAPRRLYVGSAIDDLWCDPRGEYLALQAAAPLWSVFGHPMEMPPADRIFAAGRHLGGDRIGWHLRAGGHELTPHDWAQFIAFMAQADG